MDPNALARVKTTDGSIWIPGQGNQDLSMRRIIKRLHDYDERLTLGRHEGSGDWCVFLKQGTSFFTQNKPYPVLGLGLNLPSVDEIMAKLMKYDSVRQGEKLLNEINRSQEEALEKIESAASEASGVVAEGAESFLHDLGKTNYKRILRPMKTTAIPGH